MSSVVRLPPNREIIDMCAAGVCARRCCSCRWVARRNSKYLKINVSKNPKMKKSKQVSRSAFAKARQMRYAEGLWGTRRAPEHAQIYQQPEQEKYMCRAKAREYIPAMCAALAVRRDIVALPSPNRNRTTRLLQAIPTKLFGESRQT